MIVSACGVLRTFTTLIPPDQCCEHADKVRKSLYCSLPTKSKPRNELNSLELCQSASLPPPDQVAPSLSLFSLYIGIDAARDELQLPARNLWLVSLVLRENLFLLFPSLSSSLILSSLFSLLIGIMTR
jgi:hypothetical protein